MTSTPSTPWHIYRDVPTSSGEVDAWLAKPPPWRDPGQPWASRVDRVKRDPPEFVSDSADERRALRYRTTNGERELDAINMALRLRRPILLKGPPGIGKSSVAYSIAHRLGLGLPLRWEISSRTTLLEGLYDYDAVSHLQATRAITGDGIDKFITLGPLGTALLPTERPRVLLVDELDKAAYDLPNDLLHVFEEGSFTIKELLRRDGGATVLPFDHTSGAAGVELVGGRVRTHHHPVVVITTNEEREFPEAFRRRCVLLTLERPTDDVLAAIVQGWLGEEVDAALLGRYRDESTDVLLQALFLQHEGADAMAVHTTLARNPGEPE
jgi:MoxR-like ATPase